MYLKISQTCRLHANERVANATFPGHKVISGVSCLCVKRLVREKKSAFEFCNQDTITNRTSFSVREKSEIGPVTRRHTAHIITSSCLLLSYSCCSLYIRPKACLYLTLILLTWRKWWAPNNASEQQMGFNSGFKGLKFFDMFRFNHHHQGACYLSFAKVTVAKTIS